MRFLMEEIRPELQQYFIERNFDGRPFDRNTRSLDLPARQGRSRRSSRSAPSATSTRVGYEYLVHSTARCRRCAEPPRVRIGGPDCTQPYDMALLNVSRDELRLR